MEWKVYFDGGFFGNGRKDRAGKELSIGKVFVWNGAVWHIPSVYVCGKGLVVDFCVEVEPEKISAFFEQWVSADGREERLSEEDREQMMQENPMSLDFHVKAEVNGKELRDRHGYGMSFVPKRCFPEGMENEPDAEAIVEHYGLDKEKGWIFHRMSFPWVTKSKLTLKKLSLELGQHPVSVPVLRFATPDIGGADGPTAVFLSAKGEGIKSHAACSALHFEPVDAVEWQAVVQVKGVQNVSIPLL